MFGYHNRKNYWSLSRPAQSLLTWLGDGPSTLRAGTAEEWTDWHSRWEGSTASLRNRIAYTVAHEWIDTLQDVVMAPVDLVSAVRYYTYNRWITKSHMLGSASLKRGQYHDLDTRVLHCLFDELVNFVELEKAHMLINWSSGCRAKYSVPWWRQLPYWLRYKPWRSREAGIEYLDWEMELTDDDTPSGTPTAQATNARIIKDLYIWWVDARPLRPDPMEASGWSQYCATRHGGSSAGFGLLGPRSDEDHARVTQLLDDTSRIELEQEQEDTRMLHALVDIRQALWT